MRFKSIYGRYVSKNCTRYAVKWDNRSRSKLQFKAKQLLKPIWLADVVFEEFPVYGTRLKIDFLNATKLIAVEVNGPQHEKFNPFFHNNSRSQWRQGMERDIAKAQWLEMNNIKLVEFIEDEIENPPKFYERLYANY